MARRERVTRESGSVVGAADRLDQPPAGALRRIFDVHRHDALYITGVHEAGFVDAHARVADRRVARNDQALFEIVEVDSVRASRNGPRAGRGTGRASAVGGHRPRVVHRRRAGVGVAGVRVAFRHGGVARSGVQRRAVARPLFRRRFVQVAGDGSASGRRGKSRRHHRAVVVSNGVTGATGDETNAKTARLRPRNDMRRFVAKPWRSASRGDLCQKAARGDDSVALERPRRIQGGSSAAPKFLFTSRASRRSIPSAANPHPELGRKSKACWMPRNELAPILRHRSACHGRGAFSARRGHFHPRGAA